MTREIKIYQIRISSSSPNQNVDVIVYGSRFLGGTLIAIFSKIVTLNKRATGVICEPLVSGRYVKIETNGEESLELCEVEVYGTGTTFNFYLIQ